MEITAKMVKELREATNAGMMDCKKALSECEGAALPEGDPPMVRVRRLDGPEK